jgi:hypothetical protein
MSWGIFKGFGKITGDAAWVSAVDSSDGRLATGDNATVQFAHGVFANRRRLRRKTAHPLQGFIVIDRLKVLAQRLAADRDAMFDDFRCLAVRERVSLDRVRGVGQLDIIILLELR